MHSKYAYILWAYPCLSVHRPSRLRVGRKPRRSFVGLSREFVARQSCLVSALITSGSILSGLPQSSMPTRTPQFSLLRKPSTAVVQVCCGTVIWRVVSSVTSLHSPTPLNRDPTSLRRRAPSRLPEAITQLELQSSSFALTRLFRY